MRAAEQLIAEQLTPTPPPTVTPPTVAAPEPLPPEPAPRQAADPKRIDYSLTFARMARVVRIAISMQTRLMTSKLEPKSKEIQPWPFHMDPRNEPLRAALNHVVADHPDSYRLRNNADQRADAELIWDCFKDIPLETLYDRIVADMGLKTTFAELPPEFQKPGFRNPDLRPPEWGPAKSRKPTTQ
jgi:hypothetical protein